MRIKKLLFGLKIGLASVLLVACTEELDLVADTGSSAVVYCVLDPADSVHYLRMGKSYLSFGDASREAPLSDSLIYHPEFYAYLVENKAGMPGELRYFQAAEGVVRDSGFFPSENLELLKVNWQLRPGAEYSLYLYSPELPKLIVGSTRIIPSVRILDPEHLPGREVTILPDQGYTLRWTNAVKYAVYQPIIRIHYQEGDAEFQMHKTETIDLPQVSSVSDAAVLTDYLNGRNFFNAIIRQMQSPPSGAKRKVIGFDLDLWSGGEEMNLWVLNEGENNSPIGTVNGYTNLDGAIGMFTCRGFTSSSNNRFSNITLNYLAHSEETAHLGFLAEGEEF